MTNKIRLLTGDAILVMRSLPWGSVDIIFTSPNPPFYKRATSEELGSEAALDAYVTKLVNVFHMALPVLKNQGSIWLHAKDTHDPNTGCMIMIPERIAVAMIQSGWILMDKFIWYRSYDDVPQTEFEDKYCFREDWDYIYRFTKYKDNFLEKHGMWTTILEFPYIKPKDNEFGSGFPEEIIDLAITTTCPPGGTVMDPFAGTGTTGVCALGQGRSFIGIDINPDKISKMRKRLGSIK